MDKQKEIEKMAADLDKAKELALGTVGSLNNGFGGWYAKCLVEKGYGDVREAEHRADVAEKALDIACQTYDDICDMADGDEPCLESAVCSICLKSYCMEQAEKELAEERKDD